jgi:hypothetical protein
MTLTESGKTLAPLVQVVAIEEHCFQLESVNALHRSSAVVRRSWSGAVSGRRDHQLHTTLNATVAAARELLAQQ